jgi:hypothetical protein
VKTLFGIAIVGAALGLVGAASGAPAKPTLTVAVSGDGTVTSKPAGISCKPRCKLHAKKGAKITLTANPNSGAEFSHWSAPCGTNFTCTVKMTGSRLVHAFFKAEPAPPPPPPPPPPPAKAGSYAGTYTDGTFIKFAVQGSSTGNFQFDNNGECDNGETVSGTLDAPGPFTVQNDGSFTGTSTYPISNGNVTVNIAGTFTTTGSASGTLHISIAFTNGPTCTSTGTWTAQDQS